MVHPEKVPAIWITHIQKLPGELKKVESELKDAKGDDACALRARAKHIRNDIARFK
jgi:hypothetical protein